MGPFEEIRKNRRPVPQGDALERSDQGFEETDQPRRCREVKPLPVAQVPHPLPHWKKGTACSKPRHRKVGRRPIELAPRQQLGRDLLRGRLPANLLHRNVHGAGDSIRVDITGHHLASFTCGVQRKGATPATNFHQGSPTLQSCGLEHLNHEIRVLSWRVNRRWYPKGECATVGCRPGLFLSGGAKVRNFSLGMRG